MFTIWHFQGKQVEICINGTLPSSGLSLPFAGLKNQAHGKVLGYILISLICAILHCNNIIQSYNMNTLCCAECADQCWKCDWQLFGFRYDISQNAKTQL